MEHVNNLEISGFKKEIVWDGEIDDGAIRDFIQTILVKHISSEVENMTRVLFNGVVLHKPEDRGEWYQAGVEIELDTSSSIVYSVAEDNIGTIEWLILKEESEEDKVIEITYDPNGIHEYNKKVDEVKPH